MTELEADDLDRHLDWLKERDLDAKRLKSELTVDGNDIDAAWKTGKLTGAELMDAFGNSHGTRVPTADDIYAARRRVAAILNARSPKVSTANRLLDNIPEALTRPLDDASVQSRIRQSIPTISAQDVILDALFTSALATHADVTLDGVRNPGAGDALVAWAARTGFPAVTSIVTPVIGSVDMRPYEVVRVQIGIARIAVLCARYVTEVTK